MAYIPNSGSVVAFQGTVPWSVLGSNQSISGTVQAQLQSTNASVITVQQGSVAAVIIGGSIAASFTPPANQSVSGVVGASIIGLPTFQTGNTSIISTVQSSVAVVIIGGSILTSVTANQSVSGTVGASIIGLPPVNVTNTNLNVSGSVIAFPVGNQSISGTVITGSLLTFPAIVSTANSTTTPVTSTLSFTGTSEEWKDFGSIVINVFTDAASGTDGLSIQQSSDGTNWDIRDTYSISSMTAGQGKTIQVQPAARFGRVVYTQGAQNSGAFRLQTIYHPQMVKPTSQRPQDGYSNETDLEQTQGFGMVYNGSTWDRQRGNTTGTAMYGSVTAIVAAWQSPSIVGTYVEDAASASGDRGLLVMGVRNDTLASVTSADGDYSSHVVGPAGELIAANAPFTKWVQGTASMLGGTPVTGSLVPVIAAQGASIFTYITGVQIANASATNVWITLLGGTNSVIGYTVAPASGGSNIVLPNALKTNANAAFSASISAVASVYVSAQGFISKT